MRDRQILYSVVVVVVVASHGYCDHRRWLDVPCFLVHYAWCMVVLVIVRDRWSFMVLQFCVWIAQPSKRQVNSLELLDSSDDEARVAESQVGSFAGHPLYLRDCCMKGRKESVWSRPEEFNLWAISCHMDRRIREVFRLVGSRQTTRGSSSSTFATNDASRRTRTAWTGVGCWNQIRRMVKHGKAYELDLETMTIHPPRWTLLGMITAEFNSWLISSWASWCVEHQTSICTKSMCPGCMWK